VVIAGFTLIFWIAITLFFAKFDIPEYKMVFWILGLIFGAQLYSWIDWLKEVKK